MLASKDVERNYRITIWKVGHGLYIAAVMGEDGSVVEEFTAYRFGDCAAWSEKHYPGIQVDVR